MRKVKFQDFINIRYAEAWDLQTKIHSELIKQKLALRSNPDLSLSYPHSLLFCEHQHVYTLGKSGSIDHLLLSEGEMNDKGVSFFKINRGGDITYHGPGQITGYPILDLDFIYTDIHRYIRDMEEAIIKTLANYDIIGDRIEGYTGVWIKAKNSNEVNRKICAIGVHCSRWVTMHGFALNVNTDLKYFDYIVPCGIVDEDKSVTSIQAELGNKVDMAEVKRVLMNELIDIYGLELDS